VTLALLISVPHAGLVVPAEVRSRCVLTQRQIVDDGDEGAAEVYDLRDCVAGYMTTDVARAIVDLNRAETDRRTDGVVKTHTCWNVPIYSEPLTQALVQELLARYYRPYHDKLTTLASGARLGIDCHTMAPFAPPVGSNPGTPRPRICLSNGEHTCPAAWLHELAACLEQSFEAQVSLNDPFQGGYIVRTHCREIPWVQLEINRADFLPAQEKRRRVCEALECFCTTVF